MNVFGICNIFILLYVIIFNRSVHSNQPGILNIGDRSDDVILLKLNQKIGPMGLITYIPNVVNAIIIVMDSGSTVWSAERIDEMVTMVRVYSLYGRNKLLYLFVVSLFESTQRFYEKREYEWYEISESVFDYKMSVMRHQRILDLKGDVYDGTFYVQEVDLYGLPAKIILPYRTYDLIEVYDDFDIIWKRESIFERCTSVTVHGTLDDPKLIHLHLSIDREFNHLFLKKEDHGWVAVNKEGFYALLNQFDLEEENKRILQS